jgi:hypothetical protein
VTHTPGAQNSWHVSCNSWFPQQRFGTMPTSPSRYERTRCVRRSWMLERAGWIAMAATTLAAVLGVLGGSGILSRAEAAAGADLAVSYLRFGRARTPQELVVEWVPNDVTASLWLERPYVDALAVTRVLPPPHSTEVASNRVYYTFGVREPGASMQVRFTVEPARAGRIGGRIGVDDGREVALRQLIFP